MRALILAIVVFGLAACSSNPSPQPTAAISCTDPRPQVCTMEYNPVCSSMKAGGTKQYASPCNACADDAVLSFLSGSCPDDE